MPTASPVVAPRYLTAEEAAAYLRSSPQTLANHRTKGLGPPYTTHGRRVLYRIDDLDSWLEARRVEPGG